MKIADGEHEGRARSTPGPTMLVDARVAVTRDRVMVVAVRAAVVACAMRRERVAVRRMVVAVRARIGRTDVIRRRRATAAPLITKPSERQQRQRATATRRRCR